MAADWVQAECSMYVELFSGIDITLITVQVYTFTHEWTVNEAFTNVKNKIQAEFYTLDH